MLTVREESLRLAVGKIGLISDTHGLMRPEALAAMSGVELIIHAGDIGKPEVLRSLAEIAPVRAIRGNNDRSGWARRLPDVFHLDINGIRLQVIHNVRDVVGDPAGQAIGAVISGHSHRPGKWARDGVLFINPGSAGPRRFKLPVAVGKIRLDGKKIHASIIELKISPPLD